MCEIKESGSSVVYQFERESRRCSSSCFLNRSKASSRSWAIRFTSLSAGDSAWYSFAGFSPAAGAQRNTRRCLIVVGPS